MKQNVRQIKEFEFVIGNDNKTNNKSL